MKDLQTLSEFLAKASRATFDDYWARFGAQVKRGEGYVDFPTQGEMAATHFTTVVRLPIEIANKCSDAICDIRAAYPDHYYYPTGDMHFTLIVLDAQFIGRADQKSIKAAGDRIEQALGALPPLEVALQGIGVFPTTIFAQVYDVSGVIEQYRTAIAGAVSEAISCDGVSAKALVRDIAFVNLVRFTHDPEPGLADMVAQLRDVEIGTFPVERVEFAQTNKLLSAPQTIIHKSVQLRQPRGL